MRRYNALFWAAVLIGVGLVLLLQNLGLLSPEVWRLIWPLFLIALGVWTLLAVFIRRRPAAAEQVTIPLEGASRARVRIRHGAGRLEIGSGTGPADLVSGTFNGGLDYRTRRNGDDLEVRMRVPPDSYPIWMWGPSGEYDWIFSLNDNVPLALELRTGASQAHLDLTDLRVADLRLDTGASSTALTLPARAGYSRVDIHAGAASIDLRVPPGVAARLRVRGGVASINVDTGRFPRTGDAYQSADYEAAANKADIDVEAGVGAIDIR